MENYKSQLYLRDNTEWYYKIMKNKDHHVIKFYNTEGYSFTYDIITNKIVG